MAFWSSALLFLAGLAGACGVGLRFIVDLEAGKPTAQIGKALQVLAGLGVTMTLTPPPEGKGRRG